METIETDLLCLLFPALGPFAMPSWTPAGAWGKPFVVLSDNVCLCNLDLGWDKPDNEGDFL